jgi:DNA end-binding protein Ku
MPRSIWSGAISFGLVNVPVRMYSAVSEHRLHFSLVHVKDGSPIGYAKYCKAEDKPVDDSEVAKAYDWDGEYVILRDEDFERAQADTYKTIDIQDFVPYEEIDPVFFDRTYYLGPDKGGEKVYALLAKAMAGDGRAAIAKFVMRERQHLACRRVRDGALILERMHFADEVRPLGDVLPESAPKLERAELELARDLIERLAGHFEPEKYADTYRDALWAIIEERRQGGTVEAKRPEAPTAAPDLMAALRASLAGGDGGGDGRSEGDGAGNGRGKGAPKRRGAAKRGDGDLARLSKAELYERAKAADIPGRADMTKDELVEALSR